VWGGGRIGARVKTAEDAVLHAEERFYSGGGDDDRHWDYCWTIVFLREFASADLLGYCILGFCGGSLARWTHQRTLGELIALFTNPPKIDKMADQEWELSHHLWDEEVAPRNPITHSFSCLRPLPVVFRR